VTGKKRKNMSDAKEFRELFDKLFDVLTESDAKISTRINAYIALNFRLFHNVFFTCISPPI